LHERRSGLPVAAEKYLKKYLKIPQLDSQGNLTTLRRENWKIRHKNEVLKANEHASYV
jgi:hypothetical protein